MTPWKLRNAAKVIRHGGVIAYPTEAVFGLGCNPLDAAAVETICAIKNRALSKGLILIGATLEQLLPYCQLSIAQQKKINTATAKPVTWIVPVHPDCPPWINGHHSSIAIRLTRHKIAAQLCLQSNMALISTSANISGHMPARTALSVQRMFANDIDFIVHGDTNRLAKPSEIRDIITGKVIRCA